MFYCNIIDNNETVSSKTGHCGTIDYDPDLYIYCNEVINSKADKKTACCGTKSYNPDWNVCCSGVINRKGIKSECCGTTSYNQISLFVVVELLDTKAATQLVVVP